MKLNYLKSTQKIAVLVTAVLLLGAAGAYAQAVNLTAAAANAVLPDGQSVPMWGYSCGAPVANSTATCAALNQAAATAGNWSPVVITVPYLSTGTSLTISLTNNLPAPVPTSLVIVGQLGGGLGTDPRVAPIRTTPSPQHLDQVATWPIAGSNPPAQGDPVFHPPSQAARVQSFGTEVATGATTSLAWTSLNPGTYLIESGTHPSIQGPMGLYGVLVVTTAPTAGNPTAVPPVPAARGIAYPNVNYDADVTLLLSEIDPVQNLAVDTAVRTVGFSETAVWSGKPGACGDPSIHSCYPPAVNYDPRYYLVNGVSFDRTSPDPSAIPIPPAAPTVLVRFVNAGLRTHIPAVVGAQTGSPAVSGFSLIAEDGNLQPDIALAVSKSLAPKPKIQNEVLLVAGKTYDVMINAPASTAPVLPVFDRQLSLSTNNHHDGGMQAYLALVPNGTAAADMQTAAATAVRTAIGATAASAASETYYCAAGKTLTVSDPAKGVLANDTGANGAKLGTVSLVGGTTSLTFNSDGTFTYNQPTTNTTCGGSFMYLVNGTVTATATITECDATTHAGCPYGAAPTANTDTYSSKISSQLRISTPGVLANDTDPSGYQLKASLPASVSGGTVTLNPDGSFTAVRSCSPNCSAAGAVTFQYQAVNSQNTASTNAATVTVNFPAPSNLAVTLVDAKTGAVLPNDYRWIIEEDRTVRNNPNANTGGLGTSFHVSHMPMVATGCVGSVSCGSGQMMLDPTNPSSGVHVNAACDPGSGICQPGQQQTEASPSQVALDPTKYYYISILPGDAADPFNAGYGGDPSACPSADPTVKCGHGMTGAPITPIILASATPAVTVRSEITPLPVAKITVFVFQDDNPLNGENDAGGGVDILAPNEPGLGGFEIVLLDAAGGLGDTTGQITYDMFNMPVTNALSSAKDPNTGLDACPISPNSNRPVGVIVTCPTYESDGKTFSPLAGQAVIDNLYPGLYEVVATPGADRIAKGEEWLQTNTLDGGKPLESFIRPGEPGYFQEFGPAGFHVMLGFANPAVINARHTEVCANDPTCNNSITGHVTTVRISRTPDERLYSSATYDAFGFTQCYVSLGDPDGEDFAFTKCADDGSFSFSNIPDGNWRITVFDQWNDILVDGLSTPVLVHGRQAKDMGDVPMQQWRTNVATRTYLDLDGNGVSSATEPGLSLVPINIRYRDGSYMGFNSTDLDGYASFNEVFPFFNWLVLEADTTRYKQTGVHVVYDAGGPADGTTGGGTSTIASHLADTIETFHLPNNLRVPGALYCNTADCTGTRNHTLANPSTGRIDPPWVTTEAWQGFIGNYEFVEFGKKPFAAGENGGIRGHVIYASTRPFDDPALLLQLSWEPAVPKVTVNLYQEGTAPDGSTSLRLVDTTTTSSWDDFAQGFRSDGVPNMNCPGQDPSSIFFYTLRDTTQWLDPLHIQLPGSSGAAGPTGPGSTNGLFKCYDGMAMFNQVQPAPYDGMYQFPSVTSRSTTSGLPTGTNCTICANNPTGDGTKMLPPGNYVVEVVVPPGYELVKEEDKNILIGDNYIAPAVQQFDALGSVFILPDQAEVNAYNFNNRVSGYNPYNPQNPTNDLGSFPRNEGDTGSVETFWPCVGQARIVPDFISEYPQSGEVAPFAGATRNLCDRKEVTLEDQMTALVKFYVFSTPHKAGKFTGIITDDYASEFDPFSPQFGEKFAVPNLPISIKDWNGTEITRTVSDQWGVFDGVTFSSWSPNPPNPTGYAPQVMVACMNDIGPGGAASPDPLYNPNYSQFCYEIPFMPGQTFYMDTPVVPTAAFAEGYNPVDCAYPATVPAIKSVISNEAPGPWVSNSGAGHTLTITALGPVQVNNYPYAGPSQPSNSLYGTKFITRNYSFGTTAGTVALVGSDGVSHPLTSVSWTDTVITGDVPAGVPPCLVQQRGNGNGGALCGNLVITAANGNQSIDAITVTIGGKAPTVLAGQTIQSAIDAATPGDMIIIPPGTYNEMLLMWKPVRLQGVGAGSVTLDANAHPAGRLLDPWRQQVVCLFGLAPDGVPRDRSKTSSPLYGTAACPTITSVTPGVAAANPMQVDRIPLEGILGWDTTTNGNLAELLQEPTLMGAYEGAAITVLAKGANFPPNSDPFQAGAEAGFPVGTVYLTNSDADCNDFPSNFLCNPSRIDGLSITDSSQGGGAVFVHGWGHKVEISNNRIFGNAGTLSGGIIVGNGETPDPTFTPVPGITPVPDCTLSPTPAGCVEQPYGLDTDVRVHNNMIARNAAYGDELFSATPSAAGGATFNSGSDNYHFNYNWVCGNLSTGDGGGVVHLGFSDMTGSTTDPTVGITHNWVLFNQSANPTIPTHGGGIGILGAAPDRTVTLPDGTTTECGSLNDADCVPGLAEGTGRGLVIDANLIMGNSAESGSGGGIRLQGVNGQDIPNLPRNPELWNNVDVTNNIIANNVAGWDGGGISLQDAVKVRFVNNTVSSNDTTGSAGTLFNTLGAPLSSSTPGPCNLVNGTGCVTTSTNKPSGLVTMQHSANLSQALLGITVVCPTGFDYGNNLNQRTNGPCRQISLPLLQNDIFWQNRAFHIAVGSLGSGTLSQQNTVALVPALNQSTEGQCVTSPAPTYWDVGVRGDTSSIGHQSGFRVSLSNSILTSIAGGYGGNSASDPHIVKPYCNGSRVPPEICMTYPAGQCNPGYNVPPGVADATLPNPLFNLAPSATVDEGNNWINLSYGPLSLLDVTNNLLGNYSINSGSPAVNSGAATATAIPSTAHDFFGNPRPQGATPNAPKPDIGAVEVGAGTQHYLSRPLPAAAPASAGGGAQ
jgi:hypothetical protein